MPTESITISCNAGYGSGGLGRHLAEIVEAARESGAPLKYFCGGLKPGDETTGVVVREKLSKLYRFTPFRFFPGAMQHAAFDFFDRAVARQLKERADVHVTFADQARFTFLKAKQLGYKRLELVAPTAHVDHVRRQHELAYSQYPIERDWLSETNRRKTLKEYELADVIRVASDYTMQTFVQQNVPREKLRRVWPRAEARFGPADHDRRDDVFRVVYTGALSVVKGVPLLIDAFRTLDLANSELVLVGATGSRPMRRYMQTVLREDPRITLAPGDPLPHLCGADVYVHPSYQDGFARAPMEALACGVPVIVTEDTGMKEYVREGINGFIVPTGDVQAVIDRLRQIQLHPFRAQPVAAVATT